MRGGSDAGDTVKSRPKRSDSITSWNSITRDMVITNLGQSLVGPATTPNANANTGAGANGSNGNFSSKNNESSVSVSAGSNAESKTPSTLVSSIVYDRNWESDMESLLKVFLLCLPGAIDN